MNALINQMQWQQQQRNKKEKKFGHKKFFPCDKVQQQDIIVMAVVANSVNS